MIIIIPDLPDIQVEGMDVAAEEITLTLRTTSLMALCPSCGTESSRIQSRYTRTLRNLPSAGRPIHLIMHVRRFFCKKRTCSQKIFPNDSQSSAVLTLSAPNGCKKHSVGLDSR